MKVSHITAIHPIGWDSFPREKLLYLNEFRLTVNLKNIGIIYEIWYPIAVILVIAAKAVSL